jgi:hypothetical protein
VRIQNVYLPEKVVTKPTAYIIPQGWWKVAELLKLNNVTMQPLKKDTSIEVEGYRIADYRSLSRQYEMHHINTNVKITRSTQLLKFRKGDWYIPMNQAANRFLVQTLEPEGEDSYFAWNYFDAILSQKEDFSDYVFEDIAATYLKNNPEAKRELEVRRRSDSTFAKNGAAQLNFVYEHSPYFEPAYLQYPVYRVPSY